MQNEHSAPGGRSIPRFGGTLCRRVTAEVPEAVAIELARIARAETKSIGAVIREALTSYLAEHDGGAA